MLVSLPVTYPILKIIDMRQKAEDARACGERIRRLHYPPFYVACMVGMFVPGFLWQPIFYYPVYPFCGAENPPSPPKTTPPGGL